jgi:hypothetical protein
VKGSCEPRTAHRVFALTAKFDSVDESFNCDRSRVLSAARRHDAVMIENNVDDADAMSLR